MKMRQGKLLGLGLLASAGIFLISTLGPGKAVATLDPEVYPYAPSLLQYQQSKAPFTPPQTCAGCHPRQYEEWTASMHALALQDPIYQGELNKAIQEVGPDIARQCKGCHSPAGVVTGELTGAGLKGLSPMALAGVSCDICHSVSGHTGHLTPYHLPGNGSLVLSPGRDGATGPVLTKYVANKPAGHCGAGFHECIEQPLLKQAELCANCHQVHHHQTYTALESTYTEWRDSHYRVNNITCQDCHMVDSETFVRSADDFRKPQRGEYRHYFNGANFLVYALVEQAALKAGDQKLAANARQKFEMAVHRLQAAADLQLDPVYRDGRLAEIRVRVQNRRAGHNLPTSLTNIRQVWLELTVRDPDGKVIMTTGSIGDDGTLPPHARLFNSDGMGENFHFAVDPWEVIAFSRHDTIPPKGYKDVYYGVSPAPGLKGELLVEARLRYRQAEQKVAHALLSAVPADIDLAEIYGLTAMPALPVVDMVSKNTTIKVTP